MSILFYIFLLRKIIFVQSYEILAFYKNYFVYYFFIFVNFADRKFFEILFFKNV